jgi:hypothetical protein
MICIAFFTVSRKTASSCSTDTGKVNSDSIENDRLSCQERCFKTVTRSDTQQRDDERPQFSREQQLQVALATKTSNISQDKHRCYSCSITRRSVAFLVSIGILVLSLVSQPCFRRRCASWNCEQTRLHNRRPSESCVFFPDGCCF